MKQKREADVELIVKGKKTDLPSMAVRKVTVPLSIWLARYTTINPTHITYFSVLIMIVSLGLFGYSGYSPCPYELRLIAACLVFFTYFLDHLDGKMARMLHMTSLKGKWIDEVSGFIYLSFLFIALFIGLRISDYKLAIVTMFSAVAAPLHYLLIYSYKHGIEPKMVTKGVEIIKKDSILPYLYGPFYLYILTIIFCAISKPEYTFYYFAAVENIFWVGIAVLQYRAVQKWEKRV